MYNESQIRISFCIDGSPGCYQCCNAVYQISFHLPNLNHFQPAGVSVCARDPFSVGEEQHIIMVL